MSRWCDHIACTKDLHDWFLWAVEQEDTYDEIGQITNYVYGRKKKILRHEVNHFWEDIHRCLTDDISRGLDFDSGDYPLCLCIHGELLLAGPRTVSLITPAEVADLVPALREIDDFWITNKLQELHSQARWFARLDDDYIVEVWWEFQELRKFYEKALKSGLPVACTISH
jgi:Domain of unknown function (DUF1877)